MRRLQFFTSFFILLLVVVPMLAAPGGQQAVKNVAVGMSREDFTAYTPGYNLTFSDRWTGVPNVPWCQFTLDSGRGHFIENSATNAYMNLFYTFDDPSPTPAAGMNVSIDVRPIVTEHTYNIIGIAEFGTFVQAAIFDAVSGNILVVDNALPVATVAFTDGNWYVIKFVFVSATTYDVEINGTLYDNTGAHYTNYLGATVTNATQFFVATSILEVAAEFEVYVDNIVPSWYNATRVPITLTGNAEVAGFPGIIGAGTGVNPYIIENLTIDGLGVYCGIQLRGITSYLIIRNTTITNARSITTHDAGIRVAYSDHVTIENCTLNNTRDLVVWESSVTMDDVDSYSTTDPIGGANSTLVINDGFFNATSIGIGLDIVCEIDGTTFNGSVGYFGNATNIFAKNVSTYPGANLYDSRIIGIVNAYGYNTIHNNTIDSEKYGILILGDRNVIDGNLVENATTNGIMTGFTNYNMISNNVIRNVTGSTANYLSKEAQAIYVRWSGYITIVNNTIENCTRGIFMGYSIAPLSLTTGNIINNNTIIGTRNAYNLNETKDPARNHNGFIGIDYDEMVTNSTITNNTFSNMNYAIRVGDQDCDLDNDTTITGNDFINVSYVLYNPHNSINTVFTENYIYGYPSVEIYEPTCAIDGNYYREYFARFPYAITVNTTTEVLEYQWAWNATLNDTRPLYWAQWYPRSTPINMQFDSTTTGSEIPFGNLKVWIDGVQVSTLRPIINHVLFRLTVRDFNDVLYHDAMYNLNATGIYFILYLPIVPVTHFSFYSSIDNFGLDFSLVKLFVNGTRVTTASPIMLSETSLITIKDYANSILYNQLLNISLTSIYVDIGLPIAYITFFNNYSQTVIFYLMKGGVTVSFIIPSLSSILVRLAMGDYTYEITDMAGNELETGDMKFASGDASSFFVLFGKVSVSPPVIPEGDAQAALIAVAWIVGGILGAVLLFSFIYSRKSGGVKGYQGKGNKRNKKYKYIIL